MKGTLFDLACCYLDQEADCLPVYQDGRVLSCFDGAISARPLRELWPACGAVKHKKVISVDAISDDLAYALIEYQNDTGIFNDVIGLIKTSGIWELICVLREKRNQIFSNVSETMPHSQTEDLQSINELLLRYCRDVYLMDASDCVALFWNGARMYHPNKDDSSFTDVEIQELHQRWKNMPDPRALKINEYSRIFFTQMLSDTVAIAKIGCAKLDNYFHDYLWLMRSEDGWRIVNKMTQVLYTGPRI